MACKRHHVKPLEKRERERKANEGRHFNDFLALLFSLYALSHTFDADNFSV